MSNVVNIGGTASVDTVEDFVRRRGSVTSHEVGRRFGWTYEEARRHMKKLQEQGAIRGETEKSTPMVEGATSAGRFRLFRNRISPNVKKCCADRTFNSY